MRYPLAHRIDAGDAIIMSEPEISTEANQLVTALMFGLLTVLVSLNVNDKLAREIYLKGNPLRRCRWNLFSGVESFPRFVGPSVAWPFSSPWRVCPIVVPSQSSALISLLTPITDSMRLCDPIGAPLSREKGFHGNRKKKIIMQTLNTVALHQLMAL